MRASAEMGCSATHVPASAAMLRQGNRRACGRKGAQRGQSFTENRNAQDEGSHLVTSLAASKAEAVRVQRNTRERLLSV
jgi:hypothetical protein